MMDKRAAATSSTVFTSDAVREHMKKRSGTLQAAKRNAALASKIKTRLMNNSSMFKVSLKQNNKALAVALSVEKEHSRKLKNEKIFLQREVEKLQLHNILFRQKLKSLNKALVEIEAFLNDNLMTAIELSSLSENLQSSLSAGPSVPTDDQFKSTCQSAGSVELPVKLPLFATPNTKQQDSPSVCEITNSYKCTASLSKEMHSDQVKFALSVPPGIYNQKLIEVDPVETTIDKNIFLKENQLCAELSCNSGFPTRVKNTQSLRQSEDLTKEYNDSSLPFCGNVTERKKHAVVCKSKTQYNIKDFDKKCSSDNLPHHASSSNTTNDMNLQENLSDLLHVISSPLKSNNENKVDFKKLLFIEKMKPEETVYDADMELTASDAGELLTVTVKDKDKLHRNKNSNANSDKILANFRKVKYSKKDKEKIKSNTEVSSNLCAEEQDTRADNSEVSKITDSQTQLSQSQTEQLPTGNSAGKQNLLNTSKYYKAQNCPSKAKDTRRTWQVSLTSPRKQTNKDTVSETFEDMESKIQKADSKSSNNKIPPEACCAENLPFQDNTSNVLLLPGTVLPTNEKQSRKNRKTSQNSFKMNTAKYYEDENGQHGECISKKCQTEIHQHDSKRGQEQKNIIMRRYNKRGSYGQSGETKSDSIHKKKTREVDQKSIHFLPGSLKCALAKASHKACIIPKENLKQSSLHKNEELKNKDALHAEAVHGNKITETQQMQAALAAQNDVARNTPQAKEQDDDAKMLKVDSSSVAHKTPHISNSPDNQVKQKQRFCSDITETTAENNYSRHIDRMGHSILDDQKVSHKLDSFMSKLKPVVQKTAFECSKSMPLNVDSFFQERLSSVELPPLHNRNASANFSKLKNSEISGESDNNKALHAGKAEGKLDHSSKETYKTTLTSCHGRKALQDLTNASIQYPKTLEEKSARPSRRGIPTICYKEPHLNSKLRRGDKFTDTQFLNSPVKRVEIKRNFKSKSKFT